MTPYDLALVLLGKADEDTAAAAKLHGDTGISDAVIGFHCQQAAEKMLKAVITAAGAAPPRTHDLSLLLSLLPANGLALDPGIDAMALRSFTPFAVEHRYEPLAPPPGFDRQAAVELISRLRAWAEGELSRLAPPTP